MSDCVLLGIISHHDWEYMAKNKKGCPFVRMCKKCGESQILKVNPEWGDNWEKATHDEALAKISRWGKLFKEPNIQEDKKKTLRFLKEMHQGAERRGD